MKNIQLGATGVLAVLIAGVFILGGAVLLTVQYVLVQQLFARERGTTPMAHIRRLRLERVRHDLLHPAADTRVLQTAARWGFEHPGRFAAAYQQAYGESPSATLARSQ